MFQAPQQAKSKQCAQCHGKQHAQYIYIVKQQNVDIRTNISTLCQKYGTSQTGFSKIQQTEPSIKQSYEQKISPTFIYVIHPPKHNEKNPTTIKSLVTKIVSSGIVT